MEVQFDLASAKTFVANGGVLYKNKPAMENSIKKYGIDRENIRCLTDFGFKPLVELKTKKQKQKFWKLFDNELAKNGVHRRRYTYVSTPYEKKPSSDTLVIK